MKKVAILGFGSMGRLHYDVWKALKGVSITRCKRPEIQINRRFSEIVDGICRQSHFFVMTVT